MRRRVDKEVTATPLAFAITWDYRCPYARIAHDHVVTGLLAGAPWDVSFLPFNLDQPHVAESGQAVWDEPDRYPGLLATAAGIVVRDRFPERFLITHRALFAARHDHSRDLRRRDAVAAVLDESGVDAGAVLGAIDDGWPLETFRKEHEAAAADYDVWGVPTFVAGGRAVFVRLLSGPAGDADLAISTVQRVVDLVGGWADLNEFKQTVVPY